MTNTAALPRLYQNHHFDSTRWDYFDSRDDDIIIGTSYKAGTTWAQAIVAHLLFPDGNLPGGPADMSPWLDMRIIPLEVVLNALAAQKHRRWPQPRSGEVGCLGVRESAGRRVHSAASRLLPGRGWSFAEPTGTWSIISL